MKAIGIDIGGSSIKWGIVNEDGKLTNKCVIKIDHNKSQENIINELVDSLLSNIKDFNGFEGIGIGCAGSIDSTNGIVVYSNNLKWKNLKLKEIIEKRIKLPIHISNDANCALLAETTFGIAKRNPNVIFLTIGTGIGSGIYLNDQLYEGDKGMGAELGHMVISTNGFNCTCGRKGCLESYVSSVGLTNLIRDGIKNKGYKNLEKIFGSTNDIDIEVFFDLVKKNNEEALKIYKEYIYYFGEGLLNICTIFKPNTIILGGGISKAGDILLNPLKEYLKKHHYGFGNKDTPTVELLISKYTADAGIIGGGALVFKKRDGYVSTLRSKVGNMPLVIANSAVVVLNKDNKVLLEKREDDGYLDIPGGSIEFGESIEDAAKRELFEETGLIALDMKLLKTYSGKLTYHLYPNGNEISGIDSIFIVTKYKGDFKLQECEVSGLDWYDINTEFTLMTPRNHQIISDLKKILKK